MALFKFNKSIEDIQERELLPDGWYQLRIAEEPIAEENKAKTGENIVLKLQTVSDNPLFNGRDFRMWLPLPVPGDSEEIYQGQSREDSKLERIAKVVKAFNGGEAPSSDEIELSQGDVAMFYITTEPAFNDDTKLVNTIDGRQAPRPVE